jgi:large subunit ribosomal protein L22
MATATLQSHNQSERKVRLVAALVKGKSVPEALDALTFLPKRAALPVKKLIESAAANAKQQGENPEELMVKNVIVENAGYIARYMPRAFGRASMIRRRKSRVKVELAPAKAK